MSPATSQGYTGHKMMNDVGIIHMGGRIYDPTLGRFLQADPFIQAPKNSQSFNRYAYVLNNPMTYTDPSGFFFKKLLKKIASVPLLNAAINFAISFIPGCQTGLCHAAYNAATTYAVTGSLKSALIGAFTSAIVPGQGFLSAGLIGGLASKVQGGNFGHGFWSAGLGAALGGQIKTGNAYANVIVSAVVGGTISKLTGGKFSNGAQTWAFSAAVQQDWSSSSKKNTLADGGSNSFDDDVTVNEGLKDNVEVVGKNVSISVSISSDGTVSQDDLKWYTNSIESDWEFNDGEFSLSVDVAVVESGGDLTLTKCTVAVCVRTNEAGKRFMAAGAAERGGTNIWHSTVQFSRVTTPAHEFGHILGFGHQPLNTNRIMSYDGYRGVGKFETEKLVSAYGN